MNAHRSRPWHLAPARILLALSVVALLWMALAAERSAAVYPGLNGKIAFATSGEYDGQMWEIDPADPVPKLLTTGDSGMDYPNYSADGSRLAFIEYSDLFVMDSDGDGKSRLFAFSGTEDKDVRWEADYQPPGGGETIPIARIASWFEAESFRTDPVFTPDGFELLVVEVDSTRVSSEICAAEDFGWGCIWEDEPGYYEDREESCEGCAGRLVTVDAETGEKTGTLLAETPGMRVSEPTIAADGTVAFTGEDDDGARIYITDLDGSPPVAITPGPDDRDPDLSPDGSAVLFTADESELMLAPVDGGSATEIPLPYVDGSDSRWIRGTALSPDGTKVVVAQTYEVFDPFEDMPVPVERGIYTAGLDGSDLTRISVPGYEPTWQPIPIPPAAEEEPPVEDGQPADRPATGSQPTAAASSAPVAEPLAAAGSTVAWAQRKRRVKLGKKSRAVVGWITCGSSDCRLGAKSARLRVGKKRFGAKVIIRRKALGSGKKAAITIKLRGKASRAALKGARKGKLVAWIRVRSAGSSKAIPFKPKLIPPRRWQRR